MAVTPKNRGVLEDAALHHSRLEGGTHVVDHIGRLQVQASPKRIADRTGDAQLGDRGVYKGPSNVVGDGYPLLPFGLSRIPHVNVGSLRLAYQARELVDAGGLMSYGTNLAAHAKKRYVRAQETDSEELSAGVIGNGELLDGCRHADRVFRQQLHRARTAGCPAWKISRQNSR
jgi:hypothetical protein